MNRKITGAALGLGLIVGVGGAAALSSSSAPVQFRPAAVQEETTTVAKVTETTMPPSAFRKNEDTPGFKPGDQTPEQVIAETSNPKRTVPTSPVSTTTTRPAIAPPLPDPVPTTVNQPTSSVPTTIPIGFLKDGDGNLKPATYKDMRP